MKVKEQIYPEFSYMREGQILFTYLHLASDPVLTEKLLGKKVTAIAYETMQDDNGSLPLLAPMSEVAGRLSVQMGCRCLEAMNGGRGIILSGVPGVASLTSTYALTNETLPYAVKIAGAGYRRAVSEDPIIADGVNVFGGELTCRSVAESPGMKYTKLKLS